MRISVVHTTPLSKMGELRPGRRAPGLAGNTVPDQFDWRLPSWQDHRCYLLQVGITSLPLLLSDALSASAAYAIAYESVAASRQAALPSLALGLAGLLLLSTLAIWSLGLYPGSGLSATDELRATSYAVMMSHVGLLLAASAYSTTAMLVVAGSAMLALISMPPTRRAARAIASRFPAWGQRVLMFGNPGDDEGIYSAMLAHPEQGLRPVGVIEFPLETGRSDGHESDDGCSHLAEAASLIRRTGVAWGIVPIARWEGERTMRRLDQIASLIPHLILVLPEWRESAREVAGAHSVGDFPALRVDVRLIMPFHSLLKRAMDLTLLTLASAVVLPLMALLALQVRRSSPGSVFYGQERLGRGGRTFKAWKFRSMVHNADQVLDQYLNQHPELKAEWRRDHKLKNDPRITRVGRFLRKTSLDELPQLWNVLRGEMSLVGPRPIVQAEVPKYAHCYSLYTRVRPGMTGLWQVSGRNNTTYETRVGLDARYVRNWSLWLDIYLLARTVKVLVKGEGAY